MAFRVGAAYTNPTAEEVYAPDDDAVMHLSRVYPVRRRTRDAVYYKRLRAFVELRVEALVDHINERIPPRILHTGWPGHHPQWDGLPAELNRHFNINITMDQGVDSVSPALELATWDLAGFGPRGQAETRAQCEARIAANRTAWRNGWINDHAQAYWQGGNAHDRGGRYHPTLRLSLRDIRRWVGDNNQGAFQNRLPGLINARLRTQSIMYLSRVVHRYVNWDVSRAPAVVANNWDMPKFLHLSQRPFWSAALIDRGEQSATTILAVVRQHVDTLLNILIR